MNSELKVLAEKFGVALEDLQYRADGRIEWVCEHGVGHTIYSPNGDYIHGCDGCCSRLYKKNELDAE